jgi:F0F1-type ATP synthase assembly protein I
MALNKAPHWLQKTLIYQALIVVLIGVGLSITNWITGLSVILGGAIYSLPAYWALKREFKRTQPTADAKQTLAQMYGNEMLKLVFTIVLFSLAFSLVKPLNPLALLLAFVGSHLLAALLPVVIDKQTSTKSK